MASGRGRDWQVVGAKQSRTRFGGGRSQLRQAPNTLF